MNSQSQKDNGNPYFIRSPRIVGTIPHGEIEIEAAPAIGHQPEINWLTVFMMPLGMIGIMALMILVVMPQFTGGGMIYSPVMLLFSCGMMIVSLTVSIFNYGSQISKYRKYEQLRKDKYEEYLEKQRSLLEEKTNEQRTILNGIHLTPDQCMGVVTDRKRRLWERMPSDDDFMSIRIGVGEMPFGMKIKTPRIGITLEEDRYLYSPQSLAEKYSVVENVPILCDFLKYQGCGIVGRYDIATSLARSMIIQAVTNHGYDELRLIGIFSNGHEYEWEWMRFLPHIFDKSRARRYISFGQYQSKELLQSVENELKFRKEMIKENGADISKLRIPYYLLITDDMSLLINHPVMSFMLENGDDIGVGHIIISDRLSGIHRSTTQVIQLGSDRSVLYIKNNGTEYVEFTADRVSVDMGERFARAMAPIRLSTQEGKDGNLPDQISFMAGYGIGRPSDLDLTDLWRNVRPEESMLVPIAVDSRGETFYFDINEKVHGPHGIVAGTTGSGKSEMIQSWILSMAIQFSPQDVSFVLIDFKGTGLIQPFLKLPHLAGKISDIDSDIGRNLIALRAELQRRKRLFDNAGTNNISGYLKLYRSGKVSEPLSYLFVIIDEYAEFKSNFPDFTAEVNSLFRTGRALGVHIILLTQNPAGVISDESESNVNFRWCLKVAGAAASKEILGGHIEAAQITEPGRAYVRIGEDDIFEQVQSFYSGAPYHPDIQKKRVTVNKVELSGNRVSLVNKESSLEHGREIDALIRHICDYTERKGILHARQIWIEQLPSTVYLSHEMCNTDERKNLFPIVGLLDDPANQTQYPFTLPLSTGGHAVIYGGPGSGKTTFLQTLIMSLCTKYTPDEVNIYIMDFGSWGMGMFQDFPHVGGVAKSDEDNNINTIADILSKILDERKKLFARDDIRVGSIQSYNRTGNEILPYIVLVIDNIASISQVFPDVGDFLQRLTGEGGNYGIYLVATSGTVSGVSYKMQPNIKLKVALQMTDSSDYVSIVGRTAIQPKNVPGRGLYHDGKVMEFQTALPVSSDDEVKRGSLIREAAEQAKTDWTGRMPRTLKTMPETIPFGTVSANNGFTLGLSTEDVEPVSIPKEIPNTLLISGTHGSGLTNLIRILILQINSRSGDRIVLFGKKEEYEDILKSNDIITDQGEIIDEFLKMLSDELQKRKEELENNREGYSATSIYIIVDGFKKFMDVIKQESLDRINAIAQIAEGLGVMLIIAESIDELNPLKGYIPAINKMANRQVIILGGKPSDHLLVDTNKLGNSRNKEFDKYEGMLFTQDGHIQFRMMYADKGE